MPRRRKKSSRSSRKPPLAFSESPLELSRQFSSPVTGAVNPVTADVISLQDDLPLTKWVSPQFDPNAPASVRRRRGRRRRQTESETEVRTACSQNPNRRRQPALADLENADTEEDRRKLDFDVGGVLEEMSNLEISGTEGRIRPDGRIPVTESSDKENEGKVGGEDRVNNSNFHGAGVGSRAMRVCPEKFDPQLRTGGSVGTPTRTREGSDATPMGGGRLEGSQSRTCRTPLCEANGVKGQTVSCPACRGACRPLATDTPVHEYDLRVSVRNRRGRLPRAAWEQLIDDVS